ncbi:MAG TPA: TraR/DksA family transcriptional regulator [Ramlibacter sp.]|jgi:DnaK suppressor protein|nr:TraR/DksA family transcriptional regulator [Ramlibacter sp.]
MTFIAEPTADCADVAQRLRHRRSELRALLQRASELAPERAPDVIDFKDLAAEDRQALLDDVTWEHAAGELAQVAAALRRIDEGSYGLCADCGEPIAQARLRALPATPFCTFCQAIHERPLMPRR